MCGIVGVLAADLSRERGRAVVGAMSDAIAHRGPDDAGLWATDGFAFGMRRLSIIDLSGGHQPMWDDSGMGVVFNGEIYNYAQIREQLGEHQFRTHSDTEVVLKTFAREGLGAIKRWNGMFGIAAWNPALRELTLIRDRMGVKPLYYYWDGKHFLFASEIKALLASSLVPRSLNMQAIWDYLTFRYVPGPETVWRGIRKLPPGHALQIREGRPPKESRYWQADVLPSDADPQADASAIRVDDEFESLFCDAVRLRLVASDVPVGVLLSGGLDSSAVAAAAIELGHRNFHTFSIGFDDPEYSELGYARAAATHVGSQHHEVVIGRDEFLNTLPDMVVSTDEPLADLASIPLLKVSQLAREHVKVVLSGEGSDEILAGYNLDATARRLHGIRRLKQLPPFVLGTGARIGRAFGGSLARRSARLAYEPLHEWPRQDRSHISVVFHEDEKRNLLKLPSCGDSRRILDAEYASSRSSDPLDRILAVYQQSWLVEDLLMKADKMSMATSLELRTPFLDYRLVEWANRQSSTTKFGSTSASRYVTKAILRRFCARRLPAAIIDRPKRGFPVPAYTWLRAGLAAWAGDVIVGPHSRLRGVISDQAVRALCARAEAGDNGAAHRVWVLVVLGYWLDAWSVSLDAAA